MTAPSAQEIREHVVRSLQEPLREAGVDPAVVPDDFDLLTSGVVDSFGLLELITEVNERFGIEVDFEALDPEALTRIGPFSRYVAGQAATAA